MTDDQRRTWSAPFRPRSYRALWSTLTTSLQPVESVDRYVRGTGEYPWTTSLRTPIGPVRLVVPHPHDVRTVNDIFHRHDYGTGRPRVVVDVGGNIGVSAAWFLSRSAHTRVHVWEPVPHNLQTLRTNVARFGDRCVVHEAALAPQAGPATLLVVPLGRSSTLAQNLPTADGRVAVEVWCEAVDDALRGVLEGEGGHIDLVKIGTGGSVEAIVDAIAVDVREAIDEIVYEYPGGVRRLSA